MKKLLSIFICAALLLSCLCVAAAETNEYEKVLSFVKQRIGSTEEYTDFSGEAYNSNGSTRYSFYWSTDSDGEYKSLSVEASAEGIITSYYKSDSTRTSEPSIKKITTAEALVAAKELLKALNPDIAGELEVTPTDNFERLYGNAYYFDVVRTHNKIPVPENSGSIRLNSDCTEITSFNISYTAPAAFAAPEGAISEADALSAYGEKLGLYPSYKYMYDNAKRSVYLSYTPEKSDSYIDALTGEVFTPDIYLARFGYLKAEAAADTANMLSGGAGGGFTEAELEGIEKIAGLISREEAEEILRENEALAIEKDAEASSVSLRADYYDKDSYTYSFNFTRETEEDDYYYCYASVDAKSGIITSFSSSRNYPKGEEADKSRELSDKLLVHLAGDKLSEYVKEDSEEGDASLRYTRIINGIKFENNTINIVSDPQSGLVTNYSMSYDNVTVPAPDGSIDEAAALSALTEQVDYYMAYKQDAEGSFRLVYMFDGSKPHEIDAFSGKLLRNGTEYEEEKPASYTDISGHYAEKYITTLASYGIALGDGEFRPDESILQKDYIALLTAAFRGNTSVIPKNGVYDEVYIQAQDFGIISKEEKNPDAVVTREMAAVYMIRAIGAEKYAKLDGIYKPPFPDVTSHAGYISILSGLGVVNGDGDGNFNPASQITRADSVIMIYNYLSE